MELELNKVYRARDGSEWKIICKNIPQNFLMVVNSKQDTIKSLTGNGSYWVSREHELDLIKLIGDDFTNTRTSNSIKQKYLAIKTCPNLSEELLISLFFEMVHEYTCSINSDTNVSGFSLKMGMITGELMKLHEEKWSQK